MIAPTTINDDVRSQNAQINIRKMNMSIERNAIFLVFEMSIAFI